MQVILLATHLICMWSYLKAVELWDAMDSRYNCLEMIAREFYK
jgi:hypothetical protein